MASQPSRPSQGPNNLTYSYARNSSTAAVVHRERQKYKYFVFPFEINHFDFWGKDRHYGRINPKGHAVAVRENFLKQLRFSSQGPIFALNFVADAWRDFCERVKELIGDEVLYNSGPYAEMTAQKGWVSPSTAYYYYLENEVYPAFEEEYLNKQGRDSGISGLDTFLNLFSGFADLVVPVGGPLSYAGYIESIYCSPLNTGLAIEISAASHAQDYPKAEDFIYDANFEVVARLATQYGFAIDANAPWRFCADLSSLVMREYILGLPLIYGDNSNRNQYTDCHEPQVPDQSAGIEPYGFSEVPGLRDVKRHAPGYAAYSPLANKRTAIEFIQGYFDIACEEVWSYDMDNLRYYLVDFYNQYVEARPFTAKYDYDRRLCSNNRNSTLHRAPVDFDVVSRDDGVYRSLWSLRSYYWIRTIERGRETTPQDREKDIQSIFNVYNLSPGGYNTKYVQALSHLQHNYVSPYVTQGTDDGTLGHRPGSHHERNNSDIPNSRRQDRMRGNLY